MRFPLLGAVLNGTASGEMVFRVAQDLDTVEYLRGISLGRAVYEACNTRDMHGLTGKAVQYRLLLGRLGPFAAPNYVDVSVPER